jgi:hypothetical protein
MNKNRQRTQQLMQAVARRRMAGQADNAIEQARFNRLVRQGVIVEGEASEKALPPKGAGMAISTT